MTGAAPGGIPRPARPEEVGALAASGRVAVVDVPMARELRGAR